MGNQMNNLHPLFRAAFDDLRDGNAALARAAAKGKLNPDGTRLNDASSKPSPCEGTPSLQRNERTIYVEEADEQ